MAFSFTKFLKVLLKPGTLTSDEAGSLEVSSGDNKVNYHNGSSRSPIVTEAHAATLTNKSIDADTNSITNIENGDIKAGAAISRDKLANGSANQVLINDGSGVMSGEAQLAITRGGTGQPTANTGFNALSPTTTKGDVIAHNGTINVRVPVGTNSQVLTANSAMASGLEWTNSAVADNSITTAKIVDLNVTTDKLAFNAVITNRIADLNVTTAKIDDRAVTAIKVAQNIILDGNCGTTGTFTVQSGAILSTSTAVNQGGLVSNGGTNGLFYPNGTGSASLDGSLGTRTLAVRTSGAATKFPLVVSAQPSTHGLMIIRGSVTSGGAVESGEGFTSVKNATGDYTITFTQAFADTPAVVAMHKGNNVFLTANLTSNTDCNLIARVSNTLTQNDSNFAFIAIGQRGA